MANSKFDSKSFNAEAFKYAVGRVPNLTMSELKKSRALAGNQDIREVFSGQNGTGYARIAMRGLLDGDAVNYDGATDITATATKTFEQGVVVVGRAKAWTERDFSYDITGGVDFMDNVAQQIAQYKDGLDQDTILKVLEGIFAMSGTKNLEFVNSHTTKLTTAMAADTLNSATNRACGANKKKFTLVFMHSNVSTGLENLNLIERLKYTDRDGITRSLDLGTWNGKLVVVDDDMPTQDVVGTGGVYTLQIGTAAVATDTIKLFGTTYTFVADDTASPTATQIKVGASGTAAQQAVNIQAKLSALTTGKAANYVFTADSDTVTMTGKADLAPYDAPTAEAGAGTTLVCTFTTTSEPVGAVNYTTYAMGEGALEYEDIGAKVPYEMDRDPKTNGGADTLYIRQRKVFAPRGLSWEKASQASTSPTDTELANGANWSLVHSGEASEQDRTYINHKSIAICRIISRG